MFGEDLLPSQATDFERALANTANIRKRLGSDLDYSEGWRYRRPVRDELSDAIYYTFGLDTLGAFVKERQLVLEHGPLFNRSRGTLQAVKDGVTLVGYPGHIDEESYKRRRWNRFQIGFYRLPDKDGAALDAVEGVANLGAAERSRMVRGYHGYDIRPTVTSVGKTARTKTAGYSGTRLRTGGAKWSFGRVGDATYSLSTVDLQALGIWFAQPPLTGWRWADLQIPWSTAGFPWNSGGPDGVSPVDGWRMIMAASLAKKGCWAKFSDANNAPIAYRKAKIVSVVSANPTGSYEFSGSKYAKADLGYDVLVDVLTDFDWLDGVTAKKVSLCFGAYPVSTLKPGVLAASPGQIVEALPPVASRDVNIQFRKTIREKIGTLLTVTA